MKTFCITAGLLGTAVCGVILWTRRPDNQYELQLVQVLFRHGSRTPLNYFPHIPEVKWEKDLLKPPGFTQMQHVVTDMYGGPQPKSDLDDKYRSRPLSGGCFSGQMTSLGMQQLYELGEKLRRKYIQDAAFLSPEFKSSEVYVRSTNVARTIQSARCLLAGLFQQKQQGVVHILTTEADQEIFYPNYKACKLLDFLGRRRFATSSLLPDIAADLEKIRADLNIPLDRKLDFIDILDELVARQAHGLAVPPVLTSWRNIVEKRAVEAMCYIHDHNNKDNLKLAVGPVLHTLISNMEEKIGGKSPISRRLFLYSVHDSTIMPCLMTMGIFDMRWPPFAAYITLELYQHIITKKPFVKVYYLDKEQLLPGCSNIYCPLAEFKKALSAYSISTEQYRSLCKQTRLDGTVTSDSPAFSFP